VVVLGAGAAGNAIVRTLKDVGVDDIVVVDRRGILGSDRRGEPGSKGDLARITNPRGVRGGLADAMAGADFFIGVSSAQVPEELVATMAPDAIVFALANPDPEIDPRIARRHAAVVATGRSDHPNQINNVLAFPGVFKGALEARATRITERMKHAAAEAIARVAAADLAPDRVIPSVFDETVAPSVAQAVARAAREEGVVRPGG
jgi:malate dehydrogenase (oxaloacetate-decarboxylating)